MIKGHGRQVLDDEVMVMSVANLKRDFRFARVLKDVGSARELVQVGTKLNPGFKWR